MTNKKPSPILDAVHETAQDLHDAGLLDEVTMREFDAQCLPPVPDYSAEDIRTIRERNRVSQSVFAAYLNVGKTTVSQWEQGQKHPRGTSLKLLSLIDRKGLEAVV
jgi:putative transcriptional regulator